MRKYRIVFVCFLATLLVALVAGCGQETVSIPDVVSVTPAQGATGVLINTTVTATFSTAMKPATITASTFTVTLGTIFVYPNPYRPNSSKYGNSTLGTGVVFSGFVTAAHVKIFTISGLLVRELGVPDGSSRCLWDTRNTANEKVAPGVYFFVASARSDTTVRATGTFAILR